MPLGMLSQLLRSHQAFFTELHVSQPCEALYRLAILMSSIVLMRSLVKHCDACKLQFQGVAYLNLANGLDKLAV